jgi:asparagine synthase (glutamine-hydrolysing)
MCGIAGIMNLNGQPVSPALLRRMADSMAHRGPDGEDWYSDGCVGLGHRRLAVIDLSPAGQQPMITPDGSHAIVFNGEIYNFRELRKELEQLGCRFVSQSDTEVLLHAYIQWGKACIDRLNGMFAFAVWDRSRRVLFIARDRYGIKPLYYAFAGNAFIFASEQKAILTHPEVSKEVDLEAVLEYFTFQNIFTDKTLLKGIKLFPPGHHASVPNKTGGEDLRCTQFWDFDFCEPAETLPEDDYVEELDRLFRQAVKRQLVSDVDVGAYLSGGMDSGSITAIAASQIPYIRTFTCGFDLHSASGLEMGFDEREKSEFMSYLFKTEHYEMVLKAGDLERVLPRFAWHMEEPRVGQSYPNFCVAQLASKFVKVVLSGTGGDELFGGYPWRYYRAVTNDDFEQYIDKYYLYWQRLIPNSQICSVFRPVWEDVKHVWTRDIFRGVFKKYDRTLTRPEDYVNHSLYFEAKTFLHGLLVVQDKLSMAHGLEERVPFLDNDLVDFAVKIPVNFKLGNLGEVVRLNENEPGLKTQKYYDQTKDGKLILRKVLEKYVPSEVTRAVKQGFSAPDASWFKGDSLNYVRRQLYDPNAKIYSYFDQDAVQTLVNEHLTGIQNRRLLIWSLLNFEWWLRTYFID